jgi:hypothetical protein
LSSLFASIIVRAPQSEFRILAKRHLPVLQGRELKEADPVPLFAPIVFSLARFVLMVCQPLQAVKR